MANITQGLADLKTWNAFADRMYASLILDTTSIKSTGSLDDSSYLAEAPKHKIYYSLPNIEPNLEIVVVDPNYFYSSEEEEEDSDGDHRAVENSNVDVDPEKSTPSPSSLKSTEAHTTEAPISDIVEPSVIGNPEDTPTKKKIELIDGLFDFVTINIDEEDPLLQGIKAFEDDPQFDLAAFIADPSEPVMLSPPSSIPIKTTDAVGKAESRSSQNQPQQAPNHETTFEYHGPRKSLKREFLGESSDSEDDCKKSKKRKINEDPVWMPTCKPNTKPMNNPIKIATQNRKVEADVKNVRVNVPKCPAKKENSSKTNGIRYGIGRGKNIFNLTKLYKREMSTDNSKYAKNERDKKLLNGNRASEQSIKQATTSTKNESPKKKQTLEQNGTTSDRHSNIHKVQKCHNKPKNNVEKMNKNADLSDFARIIVASMVTKPKRKPDLTKRKNSPKQIQLNHFKELSAHDKIKLARKTLQSKTCQPFKIQERVPPVHHIPVISSKPLRTGSVEKLIKLPDQQSKMNTDNGCGTEKGELPTEKAKIVSMESSNNNNASDLNKNSNVPAKRKITLQEYLKRKVMQSA